MSVAGNIRESSQEGLTTDAESATVNAVVSQDESENTFTVA